MNEDSLDFSRKLDHEEEPIAAEVEQAGIAMQLDTECQIYYYCTRHKKRERANVKVQDIEVMFMYMYVHCTSVSCDTRTYSYICSLSITDLLLFS